MDNQVKITYNKLGYAPLVGWIVRFYLIFKEFLEKMQKKKKKKQLGQRLNMTS